MTITNAEYRVRVHDDQVIMEHVAFSRHVNISFRRTIRVPDNNDANFLPPDLGKFPLYKMRDYAARVPEEMAIKGGLFFPMHQREAMWINFSAKGPSAIKAFSGGINCVSGKYCSSPPATGKTGPKDFQDYVVVPSQKWIDSIVVSPGIVKQFVAMPMGSGYSVEAQLTGAEVQGGLQLEITPAKYSHLWASVYQGRMALIFKTLTGKEMVVHCHADDLVGLLKNRIQDEEGIPVDQQRIVFAGKELEDGRTLCDYNIRNGAAILLVMRLRGGGYISPNQPMALAAGGLVKQSIHRDDYDPRLWNRDATAAVRVQMLDPATFRRVTGKSPPRCPISAKEYAEAGLPVFKLADEVPGEGVAGDFGAVKSVNEIDQERGLAGGAEEGVQPQVVDIGGPPRYNVPELVTDAEDLLNPDGPFGVFKTVTELEEESKKLRGDPPDGS